MEEDQNVVESASVWDAATREQLQHQKQQQQKELEEDSVEPNVTKKDEYTNVKSVSNVISKPFGT